MTEETAILTRQQWALCAGFISAATGRVMPAETLEAYYTMLKDIPFAVLQTACKHAIQSEETTWLPSVGLIRKFAAEAMYGVLPPAWQEWQRVESAYVGCWSPEDYRRADATLPEFTLRVYEATGKRSVESQFIKTYEAMAKCEMELRKISPELRPVITGNNVATPRLSGQSRSRLIGMETN